MHSNEVGLAQIRKWESIEYSGNHPQADEREIMVKLMLMPIFKKDFWWLSKQETLEESQDSGCGSGNDTQVRNRKEINSSGKERQVKQKKAKYPNRDVQEFGYTPTCKNVDSNGDIFYWHPALKFWAQKSILDPSHFLAKIKKVEARSWKFIQKIRKVGGEILFWLGN